MSSEQRRLVAKQRFENAVLERGFIQLSPYINSKKKVKVLCNHKPHHVWMVSPEKFSHRNCPMCVGRVKDSLLIAKWIAAKRGGKCIGSVYSINKNARYLWECEEGHQWEANFTHISSDGRWCPYCNGNASKQYFTDDNVHLVKNATRVFTIEEFANSIGMYKNTLRRNLKRLGTSWSELKCQHTR